ncbi:hypothetical protein JCM14036_30520 [Desulfotomaculum defluvii]
MNFLDVILPSKKAEIEQLKQQVKDLEIQNKNLKNKNINLQNQLEITRQEKLGLIKKIENFEKTDQHYYNTAIELMLSDKYEEALEGFDELLLKFPSTTLKIDVQKRKEEIKTKINIIYKNEVEKYLQLFEETKRCEYKQAISKLTAYLAEKHPLDLLYKANKLLEMIQDKLALTEAEKQFEETCGIKVISVDASWVLLESSNFLQPQINFSLRNNSQQEILSLSIKASFVEVERQQVFGQGKSYPISSIDIPLKPGLSIDATLQSDMGFRINEDTNLEMFTFPELVADIYFEIKRIDLNYLGYPKEFFYKKISIKNRFIRKTA